MTYLRILITLIFLSIQVIFGGCTPHQPSIIEEDSQLRTLGLDTDDYNDIASELAASILSDPVLPLDNSKVLSLGPVDTEQCIYKFDTRTFQEKVQTILLRSHKIQVNFAVDALKDNSPGEARYEVMKLQWYKESTVDPEDLRTFGGLAKVDYLLFGRLSSQERRGYGRTEVTYTFNWKLGDCETGLLAWADEQEKTKVAR